MEDKPVEKECPNCGRKQLWDVLWGFAICSSSYAHFLGCPPLSFGDKNNGIQNH